MSILRYVLLGFSALALVLLLLFWTVSGRSSDLLVFLVAAYLVANIVYIVFSAPNIRVSSIFDRAATGLAFASLELQHQAKEAKLREAEVERIQAEDAEQRRHKLRAAEEFMNYLRQNPLSRGRLPLDVRQIALRGDAKSIALPAPELARPPQPELNGRVRVDAGAPGEASVAAPPVSAPLAESQHQR